MNDSKRKVRFGSVTPVLLVVSVCHATSVAIAQEAAASQAVEAAAGLNLVIVEGDGAVNNMKARTAREAIVQVEDSNHKPVAGALVTFTAPGAGPTGLFGNGSRVLTVLTNSKGQAVMNGLRTNHVAGAFKVNVTASFHGQTTAAATITQTNVAATAGTTATTGLLSVKAIAIVASVGAAVVTGTVVGLTRGNDKPNAPVNSGTSISAGPVTLGPPH